MKITIITSDKAVYIDNVCTMDLDLAGIPPEVSALQWQGENGWIEFNGVAPNEAIDELPQWASDAVSAWQAQDDMVAQQTEPTPLTDEQKLSLIRTERDKRLSVSDWSELPSVVRLHDEAWVEGWETYRQALRDLPENITNIDDVAFPVPPQ